MQGTSLGVKCIIGKTLLIFFFWAEVGIYKRKQESKKTRKHAFNKESDQEKKKKERKHALDQESYQEKKK